MEQINFNDKQQKKNQAEPLSNVHFTHYHNDLIKLILQAKSTASVSGEDIVAYLNNISAETRKRPTWNTSYKRIFVIQKRDEKGNYLQSSITMKKAIHQL